MRNRTKLLIFHPTIAPYRIDFFNGLYREFETRICLQFWNLKDQTFDYQKIYDQFDFTPIYLHEGSVSFLIRQVLCQIREYQPDIILTPEYGIITVCVAIYKFVRRKKYKHIIITDDSYDMIAKGEDFSKLHGLSRRLLTRFANEVVVVSPMVESWYKDHFKKGVYFPIIIDDEKAVSMYTRLLPLSREIRSRYSLEGKKVLLSVSRLVDLKNIGRVIESISHINLCNFVFVIIGDGPERQKLEAQAKLVDKDILFVGRLEGDELYAWYNIASVFVLASIKEPFGAVTNEALLAGCRVIISQKAGSSCLVSDNNGMVVNPFDIPSIAEAIQKQFMDSSIPSLYAARDSLMEEAFKERMKILVERMNSLVEGEK